MDRLYVVGGQQREGRPLLATTNWYEYHKGLVLEVGVDSAEASVCLEYVSPPEVRAEGEPPILFKCATLEGDRLYLCTHSEILIFEVPSFERVGYITLPCFNDVHHVRPTPEGTLIAANTGLDCVLEVTLDGKVVREWGVLGQDPWERFSRDIDYRKVPSTKPHQAHPNYTFFLDGELWVSRFEQKDAVSLTNPHRRIEIGVERIHDGVVHGDFIYFSSVKGDIAIVSKTSLKLEQIVELPRFHPEGTLLGWCRGLMIDKDGHAWVGFSHIRPTKFRENIGWVAHGFRRAMPSNVACYDLENGVCLRQVDVERHGLDAVFSVFPAPGSSNA
jgi:hypothetical protein